jgi:thiamine biosynthesis lipoprotein
VQVGPETFECLKIACRLFEETNHAFDITVGSLFACLLDENKMPRMVSKDEVEIALSKTGANLLELDEEWLTVKVAVEGVRIDSGGIGKGFALDKIGQLLREWSIDRAMIHGGYSSVLALDAPEGMEGWPITFSNPLDRREAIVRLVLENKAVSGSGVDQGMHIIDPRKAKPVVGKVASWSCAGDAATSDGLSTAFMVMSDEEIRGYCEAHLGVKGLVVDKATLGVNKAKYSFYGEWLDEERL